MRSKTAEYGRDITVKSFLVYCCLAATLVVEPISSFSHPSSIPQASSFARVATLQKSTRELSRRFLLPDPASALQDLAVYKNILDSAALGIPGPIQSLMIAEAVPQSVGSASSLATNSDVWVFVAGIIPFGWATIEFWRRIAVGDSFGTGSDSIVIIGEDSNPDSSRGRRVLGKDALVVAYILFGIAAAVLGVVMYTVVTSDAPPADFSAAASSSVVSGGLDVM